MTRRLYAIVDGSADLLDVVEGPLPRAIEQAREIAGPDRQVRLDDVPAEDEDEEEADEPPALAANAPPLEEQPFEAARRSRLPRVSLPDVMELSLDEAHAELRPYFPDAAVYDRPGSMARALLGTNYKMDKPPRIDAPRRGLVRRRTKPVHVMGLSLLPHRLTLRQLGMRGTFCYRSVRECRATCLVNSGRNTQGLYLLAIKRARSEALLRAPVAFMRMMVDAVERAVEAARASGEVPMFRMNVYSDIPWELVFPDLFYAVPGAVFYDYTKVPARRPPENYDLTFSYSGRNMEDVVYELGRGSRLAVVFMTRKHELPATFMGLPVIDGDVHDIRPYDPPHVVVGLSYKNVAGLKRETAETKYSVFVVPVEEIDGELVAAETPRHAGALGFEESETRDE